MIEEGDNGEEREDETEEQKATREYYERSVELERLRCKYYYSPFILLAYNINCTFLYIGRSGSLTMASGE